MEAVAVAAAAAAAAVVVVAEPAAPVISGRYVRDPVEKPLPALNKFAGNTMENLEFSKADQGLETIVGYSWLRKFLLGGNPQAIARMALVQEDFTVHLAGNKVPTSIIWGRDDDVSPLRTAKLLAGKLPVSRLRIVGRAGHVPLWDQPMCLSGSGWPSSPASSSTSLPFITEKRMM